MRGPRTSDWKPILAAAGAALAVGALGGAMTELGPWYRGLVKPSWQPADFLFAPVWTTIFALAAVSGVLAWRGARDSATRTRIIWLFALNGALNILWTVLFFRVQRPDWALYEVGFLWLSIIALMVAVAPSSRTASWLFVPYLLWVAFAAVLNWEIVRLNGPF